MTKLGGRVTPRGSRTRGIGLLRDLKIDRVRLHDARHTGGTLMHLRGVPIAAISAWLGHSSAAFTMSVYVHSQNDALKAAARCCGGVEAI